MGSYRVPLVYPWGPAHGVCRYVMGSFENLRIRASVFGNKMCVKNATYLSVIMRGRMQYKNECIYFVFASSLGTFQEKKKRKTMKNAIGTETNFKML